MHLVIARLRGAQRIIGLEVEKTRLEVAQRFHADLYILAQEEDPVDAVLRTTGGRGAEVVIVACPSHEAQQQALAMAAKGGRVSLFGGLPKDNPMVPLNTNLIHYREISVVGAFGAPFSMLRKAVELVASGAIPVELFITGRFALEDIREAFKAAAKADSLRVVVLP